jgi:hypothetical protein
MTQIIQYIPVFSYVYLMETILSPKELKKGEKVAFGNKVCIKISCVKHVLTSQLNFSHE